MIMLRAYLDIKIFCNFENCIVCKLLESQTSNSIIKSESNAFKLTWVKEIDTNHYLMQKIKNHADNAFWHLDLSFFHEQQVLNE